MCIFNLFLQIPQSFVLRPYKSLGLYHLFGIFKIEGKCTVVNISDIKHNYGVTDDIFSTRKREINKT